MTGQLNAWTHLASALDAAPASATVAVFARDLSTGATFGLQEDVVLPAASTIKIVILAALAREADAGRLDLESVRPVLDSQRAGGSGVMASLHTPNLALTLADHATLMITISDNTASNVLIDAVGMDAIHTTQRHLGLTGTSLNRHFLGRLPDPGDPENLATARDLGSVLIAIATGTAASQPQCNWMMDILRGQHYTDRLGRDLPDGVSFAGKSGSLDGLSHDCGILNGSNGRAVVTVLTQRVPGTFGAAELAGQIGRAVAIDLSLA